MAVRNTRSWRIDIRPDRMTSTYAYWLSTQPNLKLKYELPHPIRCPTPTYVEWSHSHRSNYINHTMSCRRPGGVRTNARSRDHALSNAHLRGRAFGSGMPILRSQCSNTAYAIATAR